MKITLEDALSLLSKYAEERTLVLAAFVTPSVSVARVTGTIRVVDGVPPHLIVGLAKNRVGKDCSHRNSHELVGP